MLEMGVAELHRLVRGAEREYSAGWVRNGTKSRYLHKPRGKLRIVQNRLASGPLLQLPVSSSATDVRGIGVIRNARRHLGRQYISLRDIRNCYHSVLPTVVDQAITSTGVPQDTAGAITKLVTVDGLLPQGAPTSPRILDLALRIIDQRIEMVARAGHVTYSRYADDLCFSADATPVEVVAFAEQELREIGLRLNSAKDRDWGPKDVKTVTGIVVGATLSASDEYVAHLDQLISVAPVAELIRHLDSLKGRINWILQLDTRTGNRLRRRLSDRLS